MKKISQQVPLSLRMPIQLRREISAIQREISAKDYPISFSEAARRVLMRGVRVYKEERGEE